MDMDRLREIDTGASSDASELIRNKSGELSDQENTSTRDSPTSTEWTDEKHCLYLKSMEASFVNQLYGSMNFVGWRSPIGSLSKSNRNSSSQTGCGVRTPSGQFKVLRDGCWQNIDFVKPGFQLKKENESGTLLSSPWIQHYRPVSKPQVIASTSHQENSLSKNKAIKSNGKKGMSSSFVSATSSKHFKKRHTYSCDQDFIVCEAEVSDQNFVSDEIKTERTSAICISKKMKDLITDAACNDQVVPHNKPARKEM